MANTFKKFRPFLVFLAKFFLSYIVLAGLYQLFLSGYDSNRFEVDPITVAVADQSVWLLEVFGSDAQSVKNPTQPCQDLIYNGRHVARIIEGCNAVSIMILFAAFVIAFSGKLRNTFWFIVAGCAIIYLLNVVRIAFLASLLYHFPKGEHILHGVVFPLFIYSVVFVLWMIWVNRYSYVKNPRSK